MRSTASSKLSARVLLLGLALPWLASLGVGVHVLLSDHTHEHPTPAPHGVLLVVGSDEHVHTVTGPGQAAVPSEPTRVSTAGAPLAAFGAGPAPSPPVPPAPSWQTGPDFCSASSPPIYSLCVLRL